MKTVLVSLLCFTTVMAYQYAIKLETDVDPYEFAMENGLRYEKQVAGFGIFTSFGNSNQQHHIARLRGVDEVHPQRTRRQFTRSDPLYPRQWHLHASPYSVRKDDSSVTVTGSGVTVAIVDDGLQHSHPDLHANYVPPLSYDFNDRDMDPAPNTYQDDGHGTSAAGVCGAVAENSHCGRGVAPRVSLAGIRLIGAPAYDYTEAEALSHRLNDIDIYSCSWGPYDDARNLEGPGPVLNEALKTGYAEGRRGKGSIYVWAGGNGRDSGDNGNYDGYANHWTTLAIGALDYDGKQSWYSESCACLTAVAPSSGVYGRGITTIDLVGYSGYSSGECTDQFGGTSSAAPLAAGIIALMLEKRPQLTNRDVQHIIAKAAKKVNPDDEDWSTANHRGYTHSHKYGFGLLDVPLLLKETIRHTLVPQLRTATSTRQRVNKIIPDRATPLEVRVSVPGAMDFVEQVLVTLSFTHSAHGQLRIELQQHNAVEGVSATSVLAEPHADLNTGSQTWTYSSIRHWGAQHNANGDWIVSIVDGVADHHRGRLQSVEIKLLGY
jgi:subtilisin family serine protease